VNDSVPSIRSDARRSEGESPRAELRRLLEESVIGAPGSLDAAVRRAAFERGELPAELAVFAARVRDRAYQITDEEVAALKLDDDTIFELIIAVAVGEAKRRLDAARAAIDAP
jgi:hypothetical protein